MLQSQRMSKKIIKTTNESADTSNFADVAAVPVAIATGGYTLYHSAREAAFDNLKNMKGLGENLQTMLSKHIEDGKTLGADGYQKIPDFHQKFSLAISERMREIGVDSPLRMWNCLYHDQKIKLTMEALTSAITVGALLTIINHRGLGEKVNSQIKQKENDEQSPNL